MRILKNITNQAVHGVQPGRLIRLTPGMAMDYVTYRAWAYISDDPKAEAEAWEGELEAMEADRTAEESRLAKEAEIAAKADAEAEALRILAAQARAEQEAEAAAEAHKLAEKAARDAAEFKFGPEIKPVSVEFRPAAAVPKKVQRIKSVEIFMASDAAPERPATPAVKPKEIK